MQIETAVRRSPKTPDYEGLDFHTTQVLDETGAASASSFTGWVSQRQRDEAQTLKQGRLLREERAAENKRASKKRCIHDGTLHIQLAHMPFLTLSKS